jgi:hypothetical protein
MANHPGLVITHKSGPTRYAWMRVAVVVQYT